MPLSVLGTIGTAVSGVSSILSGIKGIFGGGDDKPKRAQPPDLVALRKVAQKAGFNPLTALYATGGGGWSGGGGGETPRLAHAADIGNALSQIADTGFNREMQQIDRETAEIQRDILRRQLETSGASTAVATGKRAFGYSIPQAVAPILERGRGSALAPSSSSYPMPRNTRSTIPVFGAGGEPRQIDKSIARRLDVRPYDTLMAGDLAEIEGELAGEVGGFLSLPNRWRNQPQGSWESGPEQLVPPQVPSAGATRLDPIFVTPDYSRSRNIPYYGVYDQRPPMLNLGR